MHYIVVMDKFEVIMYEKDSKTVPVKEFILSQNEKMQAKIIRTVELLSTYGNGLRDPYTKHLDDGIFELRIKFSSNITRILYFFYVDKKIVLTNGFTKKTMRTPKNEIALAKKHRDDYIKREGI